MTYMHVQICTNGQIPEINKRGPIPDIELDIDLINRLADRGVLILTMSGEPIVHVDQTGKQDMFEPKFAKPHDPESRVVVLKDSIGMSDKIIKEPITHDNDPYAGMSKKQRKKARAEAAAAAAAATQTCPEEHITNTEQEQAPVTTDQMPSEITDQSVGSNGPVSENTDNPKE